MKNSLKADPSRTATLRRVFQTAVQKRFNELKRRIKKLIETDDAFGLKESQSSTTNSAVITNTRWKARTSDEKLRLFQSWLFDQYAELGLDSITQIKNAFWHKYVADSYMKGVQRAFIDSRKDKLQKLDFFEGTKHQFLSQSFGHPVSIEKVKLMSSRVLTDLQGVNQAVASQLSRELTDGFAQQLHPRVIASNIAKKVDTIGKTRATTIARTEVIRVHAEGQLDAFEKLGIEKLGVAVEWSTSADDRVCPLCEPLEGKSFTLKEAHGEIPRHPNCRCTWIPADPD